MSNEIKWREWDGLRFFHVNIDSDDKIFQLSTGHKDSKLKDIYEGDIVRGKHFIDTEEYIGVVEYERGNFAVFSKKHRRICFDAFKGGLEVIGNIYQNPELLHE